MAAPTYDSQQIEALARIFAEAAFEQLWAQAEARQSTAENSGAPQAKTEAAA